MAEEKKDNEQVIVIRNGEENTHHLTWGQYGHQLNRYKYWVLGATLVCGIVGYLFMSVYLNPKSEKLTSNFTYDIAVKADEDTGSTYYMDGSAFNFYEITNQENIRSIIKDTKDDSGNVKYSRLDADKIIQDNAISIALQKDSDGKNLSTSDFAYTITVAVKDFKTVSTATSFIEDLVSLTQTKAASIVSSYSVSQVLDEKFSSYEFEDQVNLLSRQYEILSDTYQGLEKSFGTDVLVNGKALDTYYSDFTLAYKKGSGTIFSDLAGELTHNSYVKYAVGQESVKIEELKKQGENDKANLADTLVLIQNAQQRVDTLKAGIGNITVDSKESAAVSAFLTAEEDLNTLTLKRTALVKDLTSLGYQVTDTYEVKTLDTTMNSPVIGKIQHLSSPTTDNWDQACVTFGTTVSSYVNKLEGELTPTNTVFRTLYANNKDSVYYSDSGVAVLTGYKSEWIGAIAGIVIGFVLSSLICTGLGVSQDRKKAEAKPAEAAVPAEKPEEKK
jgi:hypothetical protein